ncbi:glutamine cyclotransferase [Yimella lutea]|uniref:Glutamine cyclotransferase n=1 Tax=Yimella lutea TaxID=587872 RepID=A0A542EGS8_9MICO|nr:glutaminyl-peptide cyclotransferase [Yimella lutea]TQJ14542.1 glutamine cyclotransferase [Yimella lutea]
MPAVPIGSSAPTLAVERHLPHDTSRFTQGLVRVRDELVETTGLVGESTLIVMDLQGRTKRSVKLPAQVFGEGVAVDPALDGGTVWVLTWKDKRILRYTWPGLSAKADLPLDTQGWGACLHDGMLWTSDGTSTISARDPKTGAVHHRIQVTTRAGVPVTMLNELECNPDGTIWSNVWMTNQIVRISTVSGQVSAVVDAAALTAEASKHRRLGPDDVLNGIATMPDGSLLLTGKRWPLMFVARVSG